MIKDWEVLCPSFDDPYTQVHPRGDEKYHLTKGTGCWCNPTVEWDLMMVIHHSSDGREILEEADKILEQYRRINAKGV